MQGGRYIPNPKTGPLNTIGRKNTMGVLKTIGRNNTMKIRPNERTKRTIFDKTPKSLELTPSVSIPDLDKQKEKDDKLVRIIKLLLEKFINENYQDTACKTIMLNEVNSLYNVRVGIPKGSNSTSTTQDENSSADGIEKQVKEAFVGLETCSAVGIEKQVKEAFVGLETFFSTLRNDGYSGLLKDSFNIDSIADVMNLYELNSILQLNKKLYPTQDFTTVMMDYINHLFNSDYVNPLPYQGDGGKHNKKHKKSKKHGKSKKHSKSKKHKKSKKHGKSKKHKKSKKSRGKKRRTMRR